MNAPPWKMLFHPDAVPDEGGCYTMQDIMGLERGGEVYYREDNEQPYEFMARAADEWRDREE